jgi:glutamate formiminotransferase
VALFECVPNFSEGRRNDVIQSIVDSIRNHDVSILDVSSDFDHNRTVVTFAGDYQPVRDAAFSAIQTASQCIDLDAHQGVHPRIGAADVVPFIPLHDCTLADCVTLAREIGEWVGREIEIPVYLYEAAALNPKRQNLAYIRKGGYEGLRTSIQQPERQPDFGPSQVGKAGAVAIGARNPLIAINVFLDTQDVTIAQSIARSIRESSGGLNQVKALGLFVNGQAQVSVNLIDYHETSLYSLIQAIQHQTALHSLQISHSEIIGLIPQTALLDYALQSLKLPVHTRTQVLEHRVGQACGDYSPIEFDKKP